MDDMPLADRLDTPKRTLDAKDDVICIDGPQPSPVCKLPCTSGDASMSTGAMDGLQAHGSSNATAAVGVDDSDRCGRHPQETVLTNAQDMLSTKGNEKGTAGAEEGDRGGIEGGDANTPVGASCVEPTGVHGITEEVDKTGSVPRIVTEYNAFSWLEAVQQEVLRLYAHLENAPACDTYICTPFGHEVLQYAIRRTATFLCVQSETVIVGHAADLKPVQSTKIWKGDAEVFCSEAEVLEFVSGVVWELWEMETWKFDPVGWYGRRGVRGKGITSASLRKRGRKRRISGPKLKAWIEQEKLRMKEGRSLPTSEDTFDSGDEVFVPSLSSLDMQWESEFAAETGGNDPARAGESCVGGSPPNPKHMWMKCTKSKERLEIVEPIEVEWNIKALLEMAERETTRLYSHLKNANCGESYISPPFQSALLRDVLSRTAQFLDAQVSTIVVGQMTKWRYVKAMRAMKVDEDTKHTETEAKEFASWIIWHKWEHASLKHDEEGWFRRRGLTSVDTKNKKRRIFAMKKRILPTILEKYIEQEKSRMAEEERMRLSANMEAASDQMVVTAGSAHVLVGADEVQEVDANTSGQGAQGLGSDEKAPFHMDKEMNIPFAPDSKTENVFTTDVGERGVASDAAGSVAVELASKEDAKAKDNTETGIVEAVKLENSKEAWVNAVLKEGLLMRAHLVQSEDHDTIFTCTAFELGPIRSLLSQTTSFLGMKPKSVVIGQNAGGDPVKTLKIRLWSHWTIAKTESELTEYVNKVVGAEWERENKKAEKKRLRLEKKSKKLEGENALKRKRDEAEGHKTPAGGSGDTDAQGSMKRSRTETAGMKSENAEVRETPAAGSDVMDTVGQANSGMHVEGMSDLKKEGEGGVRAEGNWFVDTEPGNVEGIARQSKDEGNGMQVVKVADVGSCDAWVEAITKEALRLNACLVRSEGKEGAFTSGGIRGGRMRNVLCNIAKVLDMKAEIIAIGQEAGFDDMKAVKCSWKAGCMVQSEEKVAEMVRERVTVEWTNMGIEYDRDAFLEGKGLTQDYVIKRKRKRKQMKKMTLSKKEMKEWRRQEELQWGKDLRERERREKMQNKAEGKDVKHEEV